MVSPQQKQYMHWFMKTPASIIISKYKLRQLEFNLWLEDEVPSLEHDIQDLKKQFTLSETYLDNMLDRKFLNEKLKEIISGFNLNIQVVLFLRFWRGYSLEQIAQTVHVTKERVRQIEAKGINKLRNPSLCRLYGFKDYIHLLEV